MTFNEKVEFYKEEVRKNPEKDIVIPRDVFHEVVFGEKSDFLALDEFFNEKGEYIGGGKIESKSETL